LRRDLAGDRRKTHRSESGAVAIRQHDIELSTQAPSSPQNAVKAIVTRQVYLGASRDYVVETADGTSLRIVTPTETAVSKGSEVLAVSAAGPLPRAGPVARRNGGRDEPQIFSTRSLKGSAALGLGRCSLLPHAPKRRRRLAITPALIEAAKKEGKIRPLFLDGPAGRRKARQGFRGGLSRDSVQIERSGSERLFQRVDQEFSSNIRAVEHHQQLRRLAFHQLEEETAGWRRSSRKTSQTFPAGISRSRWHVATTRVYLS